MSTNTNPDKGAENTVSRHFEMIDFPADPVNELESPWIISEKDLADEFNKVTEADIAEDREDRALHGVSRRNIWNFNSHWIALLAMGARRLEAEATEDKDREFYDALVEGAIACNEFSMGESNNLAVYADKAAHKAEVTRWVSVWKPLNDAFFVLLKENWKNLPADGQVWSQDDIDAIARAFDGDFSYNEAVNLIPDPITPGVPADDMTEHLDQRRFRGYSDWDLKGFRLFLTWIVAQATVFLTSSTAVGFPQNPAKGINTMLDYCKIQRGLVIDMLRGELRVAASGTADAPYMTAVSRMLDSIPDMWD